MIIQLTVGSSPRICNFIFGSILMKGQQAIAILLRVRARAGNKLRKKLLESVLAISKCQVLENKTNIHAVLVKML